MAQDWDIKPLSNVCGGCNAPFEDRQPYFSVLTFGNEGYARSDYCQKCSQSGKNSDSSYSFWQGIYKAPPPKPEEPVKKETAESLLRRLMEGDSTKKNVIYILGVMLERKRIFIERDVRVNDDGNMVRVYEHRKTGETFLITDPRLRLDQLAEVQREVVAMLESGKNETLNVEEMERAQKTDGETPLGECRQP